MLSMLYMTVQNVIEHYPKQFNKLSYYWHHVIVFNKIFITLFNNRNLFGKALGKVPVCSDQLNITQSGCAYNSAQYFRRNAGKSSGSVVHLGSNFFKVFKIWSSIQRERDKFSTVSFSINQFSKLPTTISIAVTLKSYIHFNVNTIEMVVSSLQNRKKKFFFDNTTKRYSLLKNMTPYSENRYKYSVCYDE